MEIVREQEQAYRGGVSGVKYFFRGPHIDWGIVLFAPGEELGRHLHNEVEETFYFVEGKGGRLVVDGREHSVRVGLAVRIEAGPGAPGSTTPIRRSRPSSSSPPITPPTK